MLASLGAALSLGVMSGLHCVAMCGPLLFSVAPSAGWKEVLRYQAGRMLSYAVLGAFAGALGQSVLAWAADERWLGLGLAVLALVIWVAWRRRAAFRPLIEGVRRVPVGRRSFLMGLVTPLLPCAPIHGALFIAAASAHPVAGAAIMAAFVWGSATLQSLGLVFGASMLRRLQPRWRAGLGVVSALLVTGVLLWRGRQMLNGGLACL